jgi:hypothetical protein
MSALIPTSRRPARHPIAIITFVFCLAQAPGIRADSAPCMANISSYVAELDALLSKERNLLTRHFPFRDREQQRTS